MAVPSAGGMRREEIPGDLDPLDRPRRSPRFTIFREVSSVLPRSGERSGPARRDGGAEDFGEEEKYLRSNCNRSIAKSHREIASVTFADSRSR